jgi:hypothetical protein
VLNTLRFSILLLFVGSSLVACPRPEPAPSGAQEVPLVRPPLPPYFRSFDAIEPAHHNYLIDPPTDGLSRAELEAIFQHDESQRLETVWGTQRVVEFTDVNAGHPTLSPVGGWLLGPTRTSGLETVDAVLFAGFGGSPQAETFQDLLVGLAPRWPLMWELCRPEKRSHQQDREVLMARNPETGAKLGLVRVTEGEQSVWQIEHVSFLSTQLNISSWWAEKGYGDCTVLGSMGTSGEFSAVEE